MWDMRRTVPIDAWPHGRTVVEFEFSDLPPRTRRWWLVVTPDGADVCDYDPGFEVEARLDTTLRIMVGIWRGDIAWKRALATGQVETDAPSEVRRALPQWLGQARLAGVARR